MNIRYLFLFVLVFVACALQAQVVKGSRVPQLTTAERTTISAINSTTARGQLVYNAEIDCMEYWNGTRWVSLCGHTNPIPRVKCLDIGNIPIPQFAPTNLGADPTLDTPKKQMAYLASSEAGGGSTTNVATRNGKVFGGRYQWGRANLPYAISQDGNYTLYDGTATSATLNNPTYDADGQIVTNDGADATALHIYGASTNNYDWAYNYKTQAERDKLWGNGVATGTATNILPGGIVYNGNSYQSPVKTINDPCPAGWRVPTQDEWERLGAYDCNPSVAGGNFTNIAITGTAPNATSPFTWVPVVCGGTVGADKCIANTTFGNSNSGTNSGYAIYITADWTNRTDQSTDADLTADTAPEPFLFLPSAGSRPQQSNLPVSGVGASGYYWSSTGNGTQAHNLYLGAANVYMDNSNYRMRGLSVRCVAE